MNGFLLAAAVALQTATGAEPAASKSGDNASLRMISAEELMALRAGAQRVDLIDVRAPMDFRAFHLVGARNIPFYLIAQAGIPRDRTLVLYCSNLQCGMSTEAARALRERGYADVRALEGGLEAALAAGFSGEGHANRAAAVRLIRPEELARRLIEKEPPMLLDTRPHNAFAAGRLPGALNRPLEEIKRGSASLALGPSGGGLRYLRGPRPSSRRYPHR